MAVKNREEPGKKAGEAVAANASPKNDFAPRLLAGKEGPSLVRHDFSPGEITALCDAAIKEARAGLDEIASVPPKSRSVENMILRFEEVLADFSEKVTPLVFMGDVHPDPGIAKEGVACRDKAEEFSISIFTRKDLYDAIKSTLPLDGAPSRLYKETILNFEDNGLGLSDGAIAKVRELKTKLAALETRFSANLNEDKTCVNFSAEELSGAAADFISRLAKAEDGKFIVTTKPPDYTEVMEKVHSSETRKRMMFAYMNRAAGENTKLLEEAICLRQEIAKVMGFPSWADYNVSRRMAGTAEKVKEFVSGLKGPLSARNREDLMALLEFKKGAFKMAMDLKLPILPISMINTRNILPPKTLKLFPGRVKMVVHDMVDVMSYKRSSLEKLMRDVRTTIENGIETYSNGWKQASGK